jgi:hypothetical protein
VSAARQFKAIYGNDSTMNGALRDAALDSLRDSAVRDGILDPTLFVTWQRRYADVLSEFPSIHRAVGNFELGLRSVAAREAQLAARAKVINDQLLTKELRRVSTGTRTPEAAIDQALKNPRLMAQLVSRLRGTDALDALRRHIWDSVAGGSSGDISKFLEANRQSLTWVFGDKHLTNLRTIAAARQMLEATPTPRGTGFETPTPVIGTAENVMGMGIPQAASRLFAVSSGRTSLRFAGIEWATRFLKSFSTKQQNQLLRQVLYDPQVARDLAAVLQLKQTPPAAAKRLYTNLLIIGNQPDDSGDDRK